jgi:hypothetical protein
VDIAKHLLLAEASANPELLAFDKDTYRDFRDRRLSKIWEVASRTVNPELI